MQSLEHILCHSSLVEPPDVLAERVMERVHSYDRKRRLLLLARALFLGFCLLLLMWSVPFFVLSLVGQEHPSLLVGIMDTITALSETAISLAGAVGILLRVLVDVRVAAILAGWAMLASLLTVLWIRILAATGLRRAGT